MPSSTRLAAGFLFLLLPSAWFAWNNRDMPQFGETHDDSLYYVAAKGLATGAGYRILSLPAEPFQTKYPPGYPLLLSLAWRLEPSFPANLKVAMLLNWLIFPAFVSLSYLWLRRTARPILATVLIALNAYVILFSTYLMSELLFGCLVLASLLLSRHAVLAALAGAAAYLVRSGGVVLVASGALCLWLEGRRKAAVQFAACILPFVLAWMIWARVHQAPGTDIVTMYYTNYFGYQLINVHLGEFHIFLWKNLDGILWGIGSLLIPRIFDSLFIKILGQTLAVAALIGVGRMARRPEVRPFVFFSLLYVLLLAVWHFPPNERFMLPLFPLLAAGFVAEMERLWNGIRAGFNHPIRSQRVAAILVGGVLAAILVGAAVSQAVTLTSLMPEMLHRQRIRLAAQRQAYDWIGENLPASATVMAAMDPLLYLYTGRQSCQIVVPTVYWYREDPKGALKHYENLVAYAKQQKMEYLYLTGKDYARDMTEDDHRQVMRTLKENKELRLLKQFETGGIYKIGEGN
jgi:hypothetical protein